MTADRFDELVRPFAEGILALSRGRRAESTSLTRFQDARYREAISVLIRKACDVLYPAVLVPEVSETAHAAAQYLGVDLSQETWHSQKRFDPGRTMFHYEHMQPVGIVLAETSKADSADAVVDTLRSMLRLAWITKEEDRRLSSLGFATTRPDPDEAYRVAGIRLISRNGSGTGSVEAVERGHGAEQRPTDAPFGSTKTTPREAEGRGGPHEPGFIPVAEGEAFAVAELGMCLGGMVRIHTDHGASLWSVGDDRSLFEAQCRAFLARTRRGEHGFREVGMFNAATGTLMLQPRFPSPSQAAEGRDGTTFEGVLIQLAPPDKPQDAWSNDLQTLLARAVQHTVGQGGQLRVEMGGWNAAPVPYCSVELAFTEERVPLLYLEASPAPRESRWWMRRMQPVDATTARLVLPAEDFNPDQAALLLRDAIDWDDVSPWDLALTYSRPPDTSAAT